MDGQQQEPRQRGFKRALRTSCMLCTLVTTGGTLCPLPEMTAPPHHHRLAAHPTACMIPRAVGRVPHSARQAPAMGNGVRITGFLAKHFTWNARAHAVPHDRLRCAHCAALDCCAGPAILAVTPPGPPAWVVFEECAYVWWRNIEANW